MPHVAASPAAPNAQSAVLTKAVLRAADHLDVKGRRLATILGVSESSLSRMRRGALTLDAGSKPFELGVLFVRLFRSLDAIVGGDDAVARAWLVNANNALAGKPLEKMETVVGLLDVLAYLDARRALV